MQYEFSLSEPPGETSNWTGLSVNKVQQHTICQAMEPVSDDHDRQDATFGSLPCEIGCITVPAPCSAVNIRGWINEWHLFTCIPGGAPRSVHALPTLGTLRAPIFGVKFCGEGCGPDG